MNPQPEPYVGNVFALVFACICLYYFIKAYNSPTSTKPDLDLFTLGFIESNKSARTTDVTNIRVINKITKQKPNFEVTQLYNDCVDALHSIGFKKNQAKKMTKDIFTSPNGPPENIQTFLELALKNK